MAMLGIDPGTTHSGYVIATTPDDVVQHGIAENVEILGIIRAHRGPVAIERIVSYGMPVGAETLETVEWIGRFWQAAGAHRVRLIPRKDVGKHVCNDGRAKDPNIRQGLLNRHGGKALAVGTIKKPGPYYGIKSHVWAALGVAVTALET